MYLQGSDALLPVAVFGLGTTELIVIGLVVLLLFGTTRIRPLMKSLGGGIRDFKKGMQEGLEEDDEDSAEVESRPRKRVASERKATDAVLESEGKKQKA